MSAHPRQTAAVEDYLDTAQCPLAASVWPRGPHTWSKQSACTDPSVDTVTVTPDTAILCCNGCGTTWTITLPTAGD